MSEQRDILANYRERIKFPEIDRIRTERREAIGRDFWAGHRALLSSLPIRRAEVELNSPAVRVGAKAELNDREHESLARIIQTLVPWRKGPFEIFGHEIDSEWRSNLKWDRIAGEIGPLDAKVIADFGCGNAYYLFRLLGLAKARGEIPEGVFGFDPSERFLLTFNLIQRYLQADNLQFELLGVEHAPLFTGLFDLVLCLGVVYHQRDPLSCLQGIFKSMRPGARMILESQVIPGDETMALFAPERYAKARNVYFIPTAECLKSWALRAGFVDVRIISVAEVGADEQRSTALAPYESLSDFLDPTDSTKTIEGYPAPMRAIVVAEKGQVE